MRSPPPTPSREVPCRADCVLFVPTAMELERLQFLAPEAVNQASWRAVEVLGFGPVAAAANGAALAAKHPGAGLVLAGIAGSYSGSPGGSTVGLPVGHAAFFDSVCLDGVGAGEGRDLVLPSSMGFPQHQDEAGKVHETLPLGRIGASDGTCDGTSDGAAEPRRLLTVCASSSSPEMVRRRRDRFPSAAAEDMEAFGLALAARLFQRQLWVVRGISNDAGDRDTSRWRIDDALAAAGQLLLALP